MPTSYLTITDGVTEEDIYEAIGGFAGSYDANTRMGGSDSHTTDFATATRDFY